jgi:hypothetical protein
MGNARDTSRQGKLLRILLKILSYHHDNGNLLNRSSMDIDLFNRIPVMAPILAPILGVHFFRGHISLKNGTFCPFSSHDSSYFKNMRLLI